MQEYCIKPSSSISFGYLLEKPHRGDSNKYPKHMFYEEIRIKQDRLYTLFCPLRILYNSKFVLMAAALGTNVDVVTRVQCITIAISTLRCSHSSQQTCVNCSEIQLRKHLFALSAKRSINATQCMQNRIRLRITVTSAKHIYQYMHFYMFS